MIYTEDFSNTQKNNDLLELIHILEFVLCKLFSSDVIFKDQQSSDYLYRLRLLKDKLTS